MKTTNPYLQIIAGLLTILVPVVNDYFNLTFSVVEVSAAVTPLLSFLVIGVTTQIKTTLKGGKTDVNK